MAETQPRHLRSRTEQGTLIVTIIEPNVQGDKLADALREELLAAVTQAGAKRIVLDFEHVKYISSAAFRPLLSLRRHLQDTGGRFVLCNLSAPVEEVFLVTRLVSTSRSSTAPFEMAKDESAAIAQLNRPEVGNDMSGKVGEV